MFVKFGFILLCVFFCIELILISPVLFERNSKKINTKKAYFIIIFSNLIFGVLWNYVAPLRIIIFILSVLLFLDILFMFNINQFIP